MRADKVLLILIVEDLILLAIVNKIKSNPIINLAKLDCGLDESPTVMVGEATTTKNSVKIGAY